MECFSFSPVTSKAVLALFRFPSELKRSFVQLSDGLVQDQGSRNYVKDMVRKNRHNAKQADIEMVSEMGIFHVEDKIRAVHYQTGLPS